MPNVRAGWKEKYKLSKHEFYMAYHYALQFYEWQSEYNNLIGIRGVNCDNERVDSSGAGDPTSTVAMRRAILREKMDLVINTAKETDPYLYPWILKAVTHESVTFKYLKTAPHDGDISIPCEKDMYYDRRRKFYWLLAHKIS